MREGGTVLWSRVCCMSGIVYLWPLQMLCTTTHFFRPSVGVLSWHSNSRCSLLVFLSLIPVRFFCFSFDSSRTARHLLVRALPNSSILIHCIPSVTWDTRVEVGFLVEVKIFCKISLIRWGMVLVQSSSPPFLYAIEYFLSMLLFILRQRRWS